MSELADDKIALDAVEDFTERLSTSVYTCYTWSYDTFKVGLRNLYEKAKQNQWDSATALSWDTDVEPESEMVPDLDKPLYGAPILATLMPSEIRKVLLEQA